MSLSSLDVYRDIEGIEIEKTWGKNFVIANNYL